MSNLITIEEHNARRREAMKHKNATGIACPHCGDEMQKDGRGVLLSYPAQQPIMCFGCNYRTNVIA